jgi:hypothetical protein
MRPSDHALGRSFTDAHKLRGEFYSVAASIKHPAFSAEVEWRLVSPPIDLKDKCVQFRPGKTTLVPYIEFEMCDVDSALLRAGSGPRPM